MSRTEMDKKSGNWTLEDLVDFELLSAEEAVSAGKVKGEAEVQRVLREKGRGLNEAAKRRLGFGAWLGVMRATGAKNRGRQVVSGLKLLGVLLFVLLFLSGVGVVRGLLVDFEWSYNDLSANKARGYHIWVFLAVVLGVQWLIILGSLLSYVFLRRWSGGLSFLAELIGKLARRIGGKVREEDWNRLLEGKKGARTGLSWRLARLLQIGAMGYNLGLLAGLFGCLWFLQVSFFWESTLPQFGPESLHSVTEVLAAPWGGGGPCESEIAAVKKGVPLVQPAGNSLPERNRLDLLWGFFLLAAVAVWGFLPRVLFYAVTVWQERKVLANLEFQDVGQRRLWRELHRVEKEMILDGPRDGVVVLDVGGIGLAPGVLRPFLLQILRVNPEATYAVDVLDNEQEIKAWKAIKGSPNGVILLVEAWSLSPKQMRSFWERLREVGGAEMNLRFLVLGEVHADRVEAPDADDFLQWQKFVDDLRDPLAEAVAFESENVINHE